MEPRGHTTILVIQDARGYTLGVLDTPMFPHRYYGGYIHVSVSDRWCAPADNSGCYFFTTEEEALAKVEKMAKQPTQILPNV